MRREAHKLQHHLTCVPQRTGGPKVPRTRGPPQARVSGGPGRLGEPAPQTPHNLGAAQPGRPPRAPASRPATGPSGPSRGWNPRATASPAGSPAGAVVGGGLCPPARVDEIVPEIGVAGQRTRLVREEGVPVVRLVSLPAAMRAARTAKYMPYRRYRTSSRSPRSTRCASRRGNRPAFRHDGQWSGGPRWGIAVAASLSHGRHVPLAFSHSGQSHRTWTSSSWAAPH